MRRGTRRLGLTALAATVALPAGAAPVELERRSGNQAAEATEPSEGAGERIRLLSDTPGDWLRHWRERRFGGREPSRYTVVEESGGLVLRGRSVASASAVWRALDLEDVGSGRLSWRWRVERTLPGNAQERSTRGDDYAARVFVFFGPELFGSETRALCYVWASHEPVGSVYPSPYSERVSTLVLESGDARAGEWVGEARDVVADFRRTFGTQPAEISGVAFMVDSDDTGLEATAWLDDLVLDPGPATAH